MRQPDEIALRPQEDVGLIDLGPGDPAGADVLYPDPGGVATAAGVVVTIRISVLNRSSTAWEEEDMVPERV